jgi:exosome complex RNA-binding protein Rrp4
LLFSFLMLFVKHLSFVCTAASGKAAGFGPLNGGYILECSTGLARVLLSKPTSPVLEALGKSLSFEIAVGMNGRVWVICTSSGNVLLFIGCHDFFWSVMGLEHC